MEGGADGSQQVDATKVEAVPSNPFDQNEPLKVGADHDEPAHPPQPPFSVDSAVTKAEKVERNGTIGEYDINDRPAKKARLVDGLHDSLPPRPTGRVKGVASVKPEYLLSTSSARETRQGENENDETSRDDAKEDRGKQEPKGKNKKKKAQGQNTKRDFGFSRDAIKLCSSRARANEFDPVDCKFGDKCKFEHNIRVYLRTGKRENLDTFDGTCPVYAIDGKCRNGWKCRFVGSHSEERDAVDGRKELILLGSTKFDDVNGVDEGEEAENTNIVNVIPTETRIKLNRRKLDTPKSDPYNDWLNRLGRDSEKGVFHKRRNEEVPDTEEGSKTNGEADDKHDKRASYFEPPFLPSEKRRLYYGPETPVLAPLTTQGNLPFRRLCVSLGAQITWSEMAMGLPLIQGDKSEWALMKAHTSETIPPRYNGSSSPPVPVFDSSYNNAHDLKFGAQIAGNKPWLALKATEVLTSICPSLRAIDLNCGCPIDLVYRQGAGSALLDTPGKLEKILRGMNAVSSDIPITVKIRMGTRDNRPTSQALVERLAFGGQESHDFGLGTCGVAAVTLHGRSRQQRYTRQADWAYIAECAAIVNSYNEERDRLTDTAAEPDARDQANTKDPGLLYFCGNGDCYSHEDYWTHIRDAKVDSVMVARGALIKPWIFEEIEAGQHLDKTASERLRYIEQFVRFGLENWGSDEIGIGTTRRFLLEWLSFACRYVPVGILEHLPPHIQDRPPAFRGRDELETMLSSDNYKDWMKISEMFLGKAHDNFKFVPKHKSQSYEVEAEG